MNWKERCLKNFRLYAITDLKDDDPGIAGKIERACLGGVDVIQLRSKTLSDQSLLALGAKIRNVATQLRKLFIVNDRVDLMLALDADGVHLGQDDMPLETARRLTRARRKIIGCSTHTLKQALEAENRGADYIGFGPIFETPTKPTYQSVGLSAIGPVMNRVKIPVVCIGGIDASNIESVVGAGARRVAVVRAIFSVRDSHQAAVKLKGLLT